MSQQITLSTFTNIYKLAARDLILSTHTAYNIEKQLHTYELLLQCGHLSKSLLQFFTNVKDRTAINTEIPNHCQNKGLQ